MYNEILNNLKEQLPIKTYKNIERRNLHLGIFTEPYLSLMLNGEKTIESRFSKRKMLPYEKITKDDIVIIKKSCSDVVGYFTIKDIKFFDLKTTDIATIKKTYNKELCVSENFWIEKQNSEYATLIFIKEIRLLKPFKINKRGMSTWLKLN